MPGCCLLGENLTGLVKEDAGLLLSFLMCSDSMTMYRAKEKMCKLGM